MRCFVVMGVSGCGKSSIGEAIADKCGMVFVDGDDLHPAANIAKMASGTPLDDADREPWLVTIGKAMAKHDGPIVVGCSALKRTYRDLIRAQLSEPVHFLHLDAPKEVLLDRVKSRRGHFMPAALLDSQFATLERLCGDEDGIEIDISQPFKDVVHASETYVKETVK